MTASMTPSASRRAIVVARLDLLGELLGDVERDRHRPERAVGEAHLVADGFVVGFLHEAGERREAAVAEHLEVAESGVVRSQEGRSRARVFSARRAGLIEIQILQLPSVGFRSEALHVITLLSLKLLRGRA